MAISGDRLRGVCFNAPIDPLDSPLHIAGRSGTFFEVEEQVSECQSLSASLQMSAASNSESL